MFNRNALLLVAGAAMVFGASSASAQARPTSTRRIPVSKEAPGEVVTPRVDTVYQYKTDTLRLPGHTDTLRLTGPSVTVTVHDTVVQQVPMSIRHVGGMYVGLGGGVALPYGSIRTVNEPGELGQVELGWQPYNSLFGVRVDGTWNRYARNPDYGALATGRSIDRPTMWTGNAGVRLTLPFFNATLGSNVRARPYLIGGGTVVHYSNLRMKLDADGSTPPAGGFGSRFAVFATDADNATTTGSNTDMGFYAGGGIGFHASRKEVFIESRGQWFQHGDSDKFHKGINTPVVFGVRFF